MERVSKRIVNRIKSLFPRRPLAWLGVFLGALVLVLVVLVAAFGGAILNHYGKAKAERAFGTAHPGYVLRIGKLEYAFGANRLVARSVTLTATNVTLVVGRVSLTGVRWTRLLSGTTALADVLAPASVEATNLNVEFPQAHYGLRCSRLRASGRASELIAEATELRPLGGDEAFFAAHVFRTPRFHVVLPECTVTGLAFGEMLQGASFRAVSIHFSSPSFDALINRDKPPEPFLKSPLMLHEALAAIRQPLQVGSLSISNGVFRYCERLAVGAAPAVLTFGAVTLSVEGIANQGETTRAIQIRGQGDLMNAGTMKVLMSIPVASQDFSLRYSGSLGEMDLTRLDAFLDISEHTRIKSGTVQEAAFEIDVAGGEARGHVSAIYQDLEIAVLDTQTGSEKGLGNRVSSFLANILKIRNANAAPGSSPRKDGAVEYVRKVDDEFMQFVWFALRSGVLDIIKH
jgi:hypothetical protein